MLTNEHFLSAGITTNDINKTHAIFFFKESTKMSKTENFKRELFRVISLNLAINQEIKQGEKNNFNCGF